MPYNFIHPQRWTVVDTLEMKLLIPLLLGASLANFVSALPFSGQSSETHTTEREDTQLLPRNKLFAAHGTYDKKNAVAFIKKIPPSKLHGLGNDVSTIHSLNRNLQPPKRNEKQTDGFRLDNQGKTSDGYHNLQVQINGDTTGKSTIGGILVKGNMGAKAVKKHLIYAVMHPDKDRHGNEYLYRPQVKDGKAPTHPDGTRKTNAEARKGKPRQSKVTNPKSRRVRKAATKEARKAPFKS